MPTTSLRASTLPGPAHHRRCLWGASAEWLGWSATLVRVLFVLVSIFSAAFPGILAYIVLWILMPERES